MDSERDDQSNLSLYRPWPTQLSGRPTILDVGTAVIGLPRELGLAVKSTMKMASTNVPALSQMTQLSQN